MEDQLPALPKTSCRHFCFPTARLPSLTVLRYVCLNLYALISCFVLGTPSVCSSPLFHSNTRKVSSPKHQVFPNVPSLDDQIYNADWGKVKPRQIPNKSRFSRGQHLWPAVYHYSGAMNSYNQMGAFMNHYKIWCGRGFCRRWFGSSNYDTHKAVFHGSIDSSEQKKSSSSNLRVALICRKLCMARVQELVN